MTFLSNHAVTLLALPAIVAGVWLLTRLIRKLRPAFRAPWQP